MRNSAKLVATAALLLSACGHPYIRYTTNAQAIADEMQKASADFAKTVPVPDGARVAIVNLDGTLAEAGNPVQSVYDHLAIALSKKPALVVERDAQGLWASVLESWSDKLPFAVSSPCNGPCPVVSATPVPAVAAPAKGNATLTFQACSSAPCDGKGECAACKSPMVGMSADDMLKIVEMMKKLDAGKEASGSAIVTAIPGAGALAMDSTQPAERNYRELFASVLLPTWFKKDGSKIVAEQASATHILGFRVLTYGAAIEAGSMKETIERTVRIDLILRLIRTADGAVIWSDRLTYEKKESFPDTLSHDLREDHYGFYPLQYAPHSAKKK